MNSTARNVTPIPKGELAERWYALLHKLHREMAMAQRKSGITQEEIAARLDSDPAFVSRCLKGRRNMTIRTIFNIVRAMDHRLVVSLMDIKFNYASAQATTETPDPFPSTTPFTTAQLNYLRALFAMGPGFSTSRICSRLEVDAEGGQEKPDAA